MAPTPVFLPGESTDGGSWWRAAVHGAPGVGHDLTCTHPGVGSLVCGRADRGGAGRCRSSRGRQGRTRREEKGARLPGEWAAQSLTGLRAGPHVQKGEDVCWLADLPGGDVLTTQLLGGRGRWRAREWPERARPALPHPALRRGESRKGPVSRPELRLCQGRALGHAGGRRGLVGSWGLGLCLQWHPGFSKDGTGKQNPSWSDGETDPKRAGRRGLGQWKTGRGALALAPAQP